MQATRAVIEATPAAGFPVAGIPLVARTVLALWTAGVRAFTVVGADQRAIDDATAEIRRVAQDIRLHWIADGAADPEQNSTMRVAVARTDGVLAAPAVTRLSERARLKNVRMRFPDHDGASLWMLTAADYAARDAGTEIAYETMEARAMDFYPVRARGDIAEAERGLFSWCVKPTDGMVSRTFNRPVSTWISRHISHTDIRPRQLTVLTGLLALATFACLLTGTVAGLIAGCVMFHVTSVVDGLDGEIARAKYMSSRSGAALDTGVDMASNLLFMIGICLGNAQVYGDIYIWTGGYIAATATTAIGVMALILRLGPGGGSFDVLQLTIQQRLASSPRFARAFVMINAVFKRDLFAFLFAIVGVAGVPNIIPWLLVFGTSAWLVTILLNAPAMLRANREDVLPPHLRPQAVAVTIKAQPLGEQPLGREEQAY